MKRKGVDYCPVIMRYATVKRELAQDSFMVTYMYNLRKTFLGKWFPPPPPTPQAKLPIRPSVPRLSDGACHAHSDFNAESGEQRD